MIEIIILGGSNSGKTILSKIIEDALAEYNLEVKNTDKDVLDSKEHTLNDIQAFNAAIKNIVAKTTSPILIKTMVQRKTITGSKI